MKEEKTLVLIKPDAVKQDAWFDIIQLYLFWGLKICKARILSIDESTARRFYAEHEGRSYFPGLIKHTTSGPTIALVISGKNAIQRVRKLNGATNPAEAKKGTIRHKYGELDGGPRNAVHGSDSKKSVEREMMVIFGENII